MNRAKNRNMAVISMTCIPTPFLSGFLGFFAFAPPNEVGFFDFLPLNELALFAFPLFAGLETVMCGIIRRINL